MKSIFSLLLLLPVLAFSQMSPDVTEMAAMLSPDGSKITQDTSTGRAIFTAAPGKEFVIVQAFSGAALYPLKDWQGIVGRDCRTLIKALETKTEDQETKKNLQSTLDKLSAEYWRLDARLNGN